MNPHKISSFNGQVKNKLIVVINLRKMMLSQGPQLKIQIQNINSNG